MSKLLTTGQIAKRLNVTRQLLYMNIIETGHWALLWDTRSEFGIKGLITYGKAGNKQIRFALSDVLKFEEKWKQARNKLTTEKLRQLLVND